MTVWIWVDESKTWILRNRFERDSEIWTDSADWEKSLNEWKETEKRDWEVTESQCSIEGVEVDSINKSNLTKKNNEGD